MNSLVSRRQMVALSACAFGAAAMFAAGFASAEGAAAPAAAEESRPDFVVGSVDEEGWVIDGKGERCVKAGTVKTVLTVNSVATEMVLLLGGEAAAASVGAGFQYGEDSLNRAMYPGLEATPLMKRDDCTLENVAALAPDLVIIDVPEIVETLRGAGIACASMSVSSPETIMSALDLLANAMGGEAVEKAAAYREAYTAAREEVAALSADLAQQDKPTVIYLRGVDRAVGAGSMPDDWITLAGGVNVAAEAGISGPGGAEMTVEAIMLANPQVMVCESPQCLEDVLANDGLSELEAVKNGRVYVAPLGPVVWSMGSSEAMLQVYWAANVINPDIYDFDIDQIARFYFEQFYGYEVSQEQLDAILKR